MSTINEKQLMEAWGALADVLKKFVLVAQQREISDEMTLKDNAMTRRYVVWGGLITSVIVVGAAVIGVAYATALGNEASGNARRIEEQLDAVMKAVTAHQAATAVEGALHEEDRGQRMLKVKAAEAAFEAQQVLDHDASPGEGQRIIEQLRLDVPPIEGSEKD